MKSILLIEDEPMVLESLQNLLSREGFRVFTATNGRQGIALQEEASADLVITDLLMPEMSGLEVIQTLLARTPELKIIAFSAGGLGPDSLNSALRLGARLAFSKPFDFNTFLNAIVFQLANQA